MFTAKEKDDVLRQISNGTTDFDNDSITNEIIQELVLQGLIQAIPLDQGIYIGCILLPKGEIFLERGGYTKLEKDRLKAQSKIWWKERGTKVADQLIALIITGIIGGIIGGFIGSYFS